MNIALANDVSVVLLVVMRSWPPADGVLTMVHKYVNFVRADNSVLQNPRGEMPRRGILGLSARSACPESDLGSSIG